MQGEDYTTSFVIGQAELCEGQRKLLSFSGPQATTMPEQPDHNEAIPHRGALFEEYPGIQNAIRNYLTSYSLPIGKSCGQIDAIGHWWYEAMTASSKPPERCLWNRRKSIEAAPVD